MTKLHRIFRDGMKINVRNSQSRCASLFRWLCASVERIAILFIQKEMPYNSPTADCFFFFKRMRHTYLLNIQQQELPAIKSLNSRLFMAPVFSIDWREGFSLSFIWYSRQTHQPPKHKNKNCIHPITQNIFFISDRKCLNIFKSWFKIVTKSVPYTQTKSLFLAFNSTNTCILF